MKSRVIQFAIVIAALTSVMGAFALISALDYTNPLGVQGTVQIYESSETTQHNSTVSILEKLASKDNVNLVKYVDDVRSPGSKRSLYIATGNTVIESGTWITRGYPDFTRDMTTTVRPLHDLHGQEANGLYFVFGDKGATERIASAIREQGYEVASKTDYTLGYMYWAISKPIGIGCVIALILCMMLSGLFALTNAKGYAVQRLQGSSNWTLIRRDVAANVWIQLLTVIVTFIGFTAFLFIYNGGHHIDVAEKMAGLLFSIFAIGVVIAYVIGFLIASAMPLLQSLKGRLPVRMATLIVYCIRIPAVMLALWSVVSTGVAVSQAAAQEQALEVWKTAGTSTVLQFSPYLSPELTDKYMQKTGKWLMEAEQQGKMILADEQRLETYYEDAVSSNDRLHGDVLLVNDAYLNQQHVVDDKGKRVEHIGDTQVEVLIPYSKRSQASDITELIQEHMMSMLPEGQKPAVKLTTDIASRRQQLFGYGGTSMPNQPALYDNAVIVVVNADSGLIAAQDYASFASEGNVLMTDPDYAITSSRKAGLGTFIYATRNVAQKAASEYAQLKADLRLDMLNILISCAILIASALAVAQMHVKSNAQQIFAQFVHGKSYVAMHRAISVVEIGIVVIPVIWSLSQVLGNMNHLDMNAAVIYDYGATYLLGGWQPLVIAVVLCINLAICLLGMSYYTKQLAHNHSREE